MFQPQEVPTTTVGTDGSFDNSLGLKIISRMDLLQLFSAGSYHLHAALYLDAISDLSIVCDHCSRFHHGMQIQLAIKAPCRSVTCNLIFFKQYQQYNLQVPDEELNLTFLGDAPLADLTAKPGTYTHANLYVYD
jgi:hypothetical protein